MADVVRSKAAKDDLLDIFDYGSGRWGIDQAMSFTFSFEDVDHLLATHPEIGRLRPEIGAGIRSWLHRGHIIVYRIDGRTVRIGRILHATADLVSLENRDWGLQ